MIQEWLIEQSENQNLLIFFGGWSSTREQIENIVDFDGFDVYIVYDYTTIEDLKLDSSRYKRVAVIAWSLGVFVASRLSLPQNSLKIAVNGTCDPVSDEYGIPVASFELTLSSIERFGMGKFNSRISRGVEHLFIPSDRSVEQLSNELSSIYETIKRSKISNSPWHFALVSKGDLIFPSKNQLNYWNKNSIFAPILSDTPHYAFDEECMNILKERLEIDR